MTLVPFDKNCPFTVIATASSHVDHIDVSFELDGPIEQLKEDSIQGDQRGFAIGLWEQCCFELFLRRDRQYIEWNLSRGGQWACFAFSDYRQKTEDLKGVEQPEVHWNTESKTLKAKLPKVLLDGREQDEFSLTCILKTGDQTHYFARVHPQDKPDFHKDCAYQKL